MKKVFRLGWVLPLALLHLAGCGSSNLGAGGGTLPADDAGAGPEGSTTPAIAGFDLHPTQGSWWEFGSSYDWNGGNPVHHDSKFVLTLGAPTTIAGDEAFPVTFTLIAGTKSDAFVWQYLSFVGSRIRGSVDGSTYETLFDARTGKWPATNDGLFGNLRHGKYLYGASPATPAAIAADPFLSGSAWSVTGVSQAGNGCEVIPGYGTVCDTDPYPASYSGRDYFREGVGMLGSYFKGCSTGCITSIVGVLDSSVAGDRPPPQPEVPDAGSGCAPLSAPSAVGVLAAAGAAPAPTGGTIGDGLYQATAVKVYGTGASAGTQVGAFGGVIKVTGSTLQMAYAGSSVASFSGMGTFVITGGTANVTFTCSTTGPGTASFGVSVAGPSSFDVTTVVGSYPTVATYTKL